MNEKMSFDDISKALLERRVKLPLRVSHKDTGVILDDDGVDLITIDVNNGRPDAEVDAIAALIAGLINLSAHTPPPQTHMEGRPDGTQS
jgi:hypothetical protein